MIEALGGVGLCPTKANAESYLLPTGLDYAQQYNRFCNSYEGSFDWLLEGWAMPNNAIVFVTALDSAGNRKIKNQKSSF